MNAAVRSFAMGCAIGATVCAPLSASTVHENHPTKVMYNALTCEAPAQSGAHTGLAALCVLNRASPQLFATDTRTGKLTSLGDYTVTDVLADVIDVIAPTAGTFTMAATGQAPATVPFTMRGEGWMFVGRNAGSETCGTKGWHYGVLYQMRLTVLDGTADYEAVDAQFPVVLGSAKTRSAALAAAAGLSATMVSEALDDMGPQVPADMIHPDLVEPDDNGVPLWVPDPNGTPDPVAARKCRFAYLNELTIAQQTYVNQMNSRTMNAYLVAAGLIGAAAGGAVAVKAGCSAAAIAKTAGIAVIVVGGSYVAWRWDLGNTYSKQRRTDANAALQRYLLCVRRAGFVPR